MAHPKRKTSRMKVRHRKASIRYKAKGIHITTCPETGIAYRSHHAYMDDGVLMYAGKVITRDANVTTA